MRTGNESRHWVRAAVMGLIVMGPTVASAELPHQPLERVGRLCGIGWGDGYHACSSSGFRPFADLPPKTYATTYGAKPHLKRRLADRIGATYYDLFDAAKAQCGKAPGCDSAPCDACDCGPAATPLGAPVSPVIAPPIQSTPGPPAQTPPEQVNSTGAPAISPPADLAIELTQPLSATLSAKKYPTRPEPPVLGAERSEAIPVASKQIAADVAAAASEPIEIPGEDMAFLGASAAIAGNWGQSLARSNRFRVAASTATPASIAPVHPGRPPSTPSRLRPTSKPFTTMTPSMQVRTLRDSTTPGEAAQPEHPQVAAKPQTPPAYVPAYAMAPYTRPRAGAANVQAPVKQSPPTRPVRLGGQTETFESVADVQRPARLGTDAASSASPFASRPVVEMATRSDPAADGLIHQPGSSLR